MISKDIAFTEMAENGLSANGLTEDQLDDQMWSGCPEDLLSRGPSRYCITEVLGSWSCGKVVNAVNLDTSKEVNIKIFYSELGSQREMKMLEIVSVLDNAKYNLVNFIEHFSDYGEHCLVFEQLDMTLPEMLQRRGSPLTLSEIRPIAYQLLEALRGLKSIGVLHADLRPENVRLVNHERKPFKVKLLNVGTSFLTSDNITGLKIQPRGYNSPEDNLGLPVTEAIDMWSLGCVLLFLYLGTHPFSVSCEYQAVKGFVDLLGQPDDDFLKAGLYSHRYFVEDNYWRDPGWSIKTKDEFQRQTGVKVKEWRSKVRSLDDLIPLYPVVNGRSEVKDRWAFVSLLKGLLQVDPEKRLTPQSALSHPFLTMVHLTGNMESPYFDLCIERMEVLDFEEDDVEAFSSVTGEHPSLESEDRGPTPPLITEELDR